MPMIPSRRHATACRTRCLPLFVLCVVAAVTVVGCARAQTSDTTVGPPVQPGALDLKTPDASVRTYLDYTSFAYRMANSEAASQVVSPMEGVRVDSYIELNRQKGQGIEQRLVRFQTRSESIEGTRAVVAAREDWRYRYFSLSTLRYTSVAYETSYDSTYTLVKDPKGWLVDRVDATPLTPVK